MKSLFFATLTFLFIGCASVDEKNDPAPPTLNTINALKDYQSAYENGLLLVQFSNNGFSIAGQERFDLLSDIKAMSDSYYSKGRSLNDLQLQAKGDFSEHISNPEGIATAYYLMQYDVVTTKAKLNALQVSNGFKVLHESNIIVPQLYGRKTILKINKEVNASELLTSDLRQQLEKLVQMGPLYQAIVTNNPDLKLTTNKIGNGVGGEQMDEYIRATTFINAQVWHNAVIAAQEVLSSN